MSSVYVSTKYMAHRTDKQSLEDSHAHNPPKRQQSPEDMHNAYTRTGFEQLITLLTDPFEYTLHYVNTICTPKYSHQPAYALTSTHTHTHKHTHTTPCAYLGVQLVLDVPQLPVGGLQLRAPSVARIHVFAVPSLYILHFSA